MSQSIEPAAIDSLERALMASNNGKPLADVVAASGLLGCSVSTVRRLIYMGAIKAYRRASNAPVQIRVRELARHILEGEQRHSLPVNPDLARRAALAEATEENI